MKLILCLVTALTACVDPPTVTLLPDDAPSFAIVAEQSVQAVAADEPSICDVLPDDGPCADACDHDALVEDVPQGVCADFRCELTDGRVVSVGACHH